MQRRKFIAAMGSLAAGGAAVMGTGAVDTIRADRGISVATAGDQDAYLGLDANDESQFVSQTGDGIAVDFGSETEAGGLCVNVGRTVARPAFSIANQSADQLFVEVNNPFANPDISTSNKTRDPSGVGITVPAGLDVQFIAVPSGTADSLSVGSAYYIDRTEDVSVGPNFQSNTDPSYLRMGPGSESSRNPSPGYLNLSAGESADVIVQVVATQNVEIDLGSADPLFTLFAQSDAQYMDIESEADI